MAIKSNPISSLAGTFWLEIDNPGEETNVVLQDISTIDFEFDLVPTQQTDARVGGIPGTITVTLWDDMTNRGSFYDALENAIGTYEDVTDITYPRANCNFIWITRKDSTEYKFPFSLSFADIGIDERTRLSTAKLNPKTLNTTIFEWGENRASSVLPNDIPYYFATYLMNINNGVMAGYAIYDTISQLNDTFGTIYETAKNLATINVTGYYGTQAVNVGAFPLLNEASNYGNGTIIPQFLFNGVSTASYIDAANTTMVDMVKKFAAMEGAIFGSAFNYNFYINRLTNVNNVVITNTDVTDLSFVSTPRAYNSITYTSRTTPNTSVGGIVFTDGESFPNSNVTFLAYRDAPQQQSFGFSNYNPWLVYGALQYDAGATIFPPYAYVNNATPIVNNRNILNTYQDALFFRSYKAFAAALGVSSTNKSAMRIELDVLDASKIKPWEVIRFNETVPSRYWGKHFRPTSLSYDLKADRVRVTAYEIDTFEFTPPGPPPPPQGDTNIKACENGTYMVSLVYATNATADPVYTNDNGNYMLFSVYATNATGDPVYSNENGNYMVEAFTGTNTMISAQSETNGTATDFTATL
jgi:hypothetical protein